MFLFLTKTHVLFSLYKCCLRCFHAAALRPREEVLIQLVLGDV